MPVMDGYETTRRLRADPRYAALPIIATSAHVMAEEYERADAAGMNGHINKPIEPDRLYATLSRIFNASTAHDPEIRSAAGAPAPPAEPHLPVIPGLDTTVGMQRSAGMRGLYQQMLASFAEDFADLGRDMSHLMAQERWDDAERLAHTLKGLAGTIGAGEVQTMAATLEAACKHGQGLVAGPLLARLLEKLVPLVAALQAHVAAASAPPPPAVPPREADAAGAIPACLPRLRQLLAEGDNDAIDLWQAREQEFKGVLSQQTMLRIGTAMKNFQLDVALDLLSEIPQHEPALAKDADA